MYDIQNRWKLKNNYLKYYGLRNKHNMFKNMIKLKKKQIEIIKKLPSELNNEEKNILKNLLNKQVVNVRSHILYILYCK